LTATLQGVKERANVPAGGLGDLRKCPRGFKEIIILKGVLFSMLYEGFPQACIVFSRLV
jgi:hypothetical protein